MPRESGAPADAGTTYGMIDAPSAMHEACTHLVTPYCAAYHRCAPEWFASQYPDEAACVGALMPDCVEQRSAPGNTTSAGDVEACAAAKGAIDCPAFFADLERPRPPGTPGCAFEGRLADAASCV